ncbi:uncharacterized protein TNCV_3912801 [Trichonephila clavipes]|nr:uncharacterized protein TNCV_3912801 [Trichonephila clavipes]
MFDSSSYVNTTPLAPADTSKDVLPSGDTSQWRPTRFNLYDPEMRNARGFNIWPEVYFSGYVTEFLEGIDNQIKLLEISSDLSCAYLKGHFTGRVLDWYQIFGSTLVQNTATDFAQLKAALSKAFPAIQNKKELETRFYASQQRQSQEPTDFVYDLLKTHKKLELGMSEKALVDHIFVRLEPQVQDYVEVRNPQTAIQLFEVLAKFEERYLCKQHWVREIVITWKDEVGMSVGCLMLKLVIVSDGTEFAVGDIERFFEEARRNTETKHENWKKYYNRRRCDVQIKVNDWVLVATHPLSSATRKVVAKFKPKFVGPYRVLDVKNNNVVIWKAGKRLTINVDQVRIYRHRKCDETEIGTGSQDNGSLRDESSGLDRVQRRSNDSRDGKKKGSETETIERKAQQGGPVRSRKGREGNDSPYIEERTRSSNKNARRIGDPQRQDQERRGTWTKKSLSLKVLVGNAIYKS